MLYSKLIEQHLANKESTFQDERHSLNYVELNKYALAFSQIITMLPPDGTVLICSINCMETCIAILGCIAVGYRYTVVHDKLTDKNKKYVLLNSKASLVVGDDSTWLAEAEYNVEFFDIYDLWKLPMDNVENHRPRVESTRDVYILYTSGSTKMPKGVLAGVSQVIFVIDAINSVLLNGEDDLIWNCLPLAFDYGMYQLFLALDAQASFYISPQPMISIIPKVLVQKKITAFPVVPSLLGMLLQSRLLSRTKGFALRYISSTGDVLPVSWIRQIETLLPHTIVVPMYGITECKRVAIMPLNEQEKKYQGSCGLPISGIEVLIDKYQEENNCGELIVYGPNVMKGYWNEGHNELSVFGFDEKKGMRYLRTGDIFRQDEDGYLYFVERKNTFIKSNGYRISGKEIDAYIINKGIGISESYTIGIPDQLLGQRIITVVSGAYEEKELRKVVLGLPQYMRPHEIKFLPSGLPKTDNGKYDKKKIYEIVVMK